MNPANDIRKQAHQGSVAAIIQVLNQELSDLNVRTRAFFDGGVLQVLCEADTPEHLSRETLPDRVKLILESLAPRGVRRVNINSRIVREQQLLWLDEINRDPDKLMWSTEIILARPNLVKTFLEDVQDSLTPNPDVINSLSPRQQREKRQFWRGIFGGVGATIALLVVGGGVYSLLQSGQSGSNSASSGASPSSVSAASPSAVSPSSVKSASSASVSPSKIPSSAGASTESFSAAVRLAEEAAAAGSKAQSSGDWTAIAEKWGKASDLMGQVPPADKNHSIAQDRTARYKANQAAAQAKAK